MTEGVSMEKAIDKVRTEIEEVFEDHGITSVDTKRFIVSYLDGLEDNDFQEMIVSEEEPEVE